MDIYQGRYKEFIEGIRRLRPSNERFDYSERHHIIPKCCNGTDDQENLIYLTYREHFTAHKILAEDYPDIPGLVYAYWRMCHSDKETEMTLEEYDSAKRLLSSTVSEFMKNRVVSEETKKKISDSKKGINHPFYGKSLSESTRSRMSISHQGHSFYGDKSKHPMLQKGRVISEDTKKRMSENHADFSGSNNPMYGKSAVKGRRWINKDGARKYIYEEELDDYLINGWKIGMR